LQTVYRWFLLKPSVNIFFFFFSCFFLFKTHCSSSSLRKKPYLSELSVVLLPLSDRRLKTDVDGIWRVGKNGTRYEIWTVGENGTCDGISRRFSAGSGRNPRSAGSVAGIQREIWPEYVDFQPVLSSSLFLSPLWPPRHHCLPNYRTDLRFFFFLVWVWNVFALHFVFVLGLELMFDG